MLYFLYDWYIFNIGTMRPWLFEQDRTGSLVLLTVRFACIGGVCFDSTFKFALFAIYSVSLETVFARCRFIVLCIY
jgi:hypothetical protein